MFHQAAVNLAQQEPEIVRKWLNSFDSIITDCDGVLWIYNEPIEGAIETIGELKQIGKKIFLATNNSSKTRAELVLKPQQLGFDVTEDEIISSAYATAAYLKYRNFEKKVYIIGTENLAQELEAGGIDSTGMGPDIMSGTLTNYLAKQYKVEQGIGAVVIGFDEHFSFPKMVKAASYLNNPDCLFIATNMNPRFPNPTLVIPGTGTLVNAMKTCADREPILIGKPSPHFCDFLIREGVIVPKRTLIIGDRGSTDMLLGYNCGFQTLLVGTGVQKFEDVDMWRKSNDSELKKQIPDVFLPKLGDLLQFLRPERRLTSERRLEPWLRQESRIESRLGANFLFRHGSRPEPQREAHGQSMQEAGQRTHPELRQDLPLESRQGTRPDFRQNPRRELPQESRQTRQETRPEMRQDRLESWQETPRQVLQEPPPNSTRERPSSSGNRRRPHK